MSTGRKSVIVSIVLATAIGSASQAYAARLFKGIAVITARTNIAPCVAEFDVAESFIIEYRANTGAETTPERISIMSTNGSLLLTSIDGTPSLRGAGQVSITGNVLTQPINIPATSAAFTISAVAATSLYVTMTGVANNVGIPGCTVNMRAALTWLPPGGY